LTTSLDGIHNYNLEEMIINLQRTKTTMSSTNIIFNFDNSYSRLPDRFFQKINPEAVEDPKLIVFNRNLGNSLGIDNIQSKDALAATFSGNELPTGSDPIALAYAGHQFGNFVNQLGDGRAVLLGEVVNKDQERFDIQLKGSGKTRFSRQGDGKSALGPVIREYILSEAMHALNIPTTRALAAVTTGEDVFRETKLPGGILTRVAKSHIRVGTFEYFMARNDLKHLKILANYVLERLYPEALESKNPYLQMLETIAEKQSQLIANWMRIGFIHGVMNTDNTSISVETIDYGPCAFMDEYNPQTVYSSIDHHGRYAFANQAQIAHWNLACLSGCLIPLVDKNEEQSKEKINKVLERFSKSVNDEISTTMIRKIGLKHQSQEGLEHLKALLKLMHENKTDYTLTFRLLSDAAHGETKEFISLFETHDAISDWIAAWKKLLDKEENNTSEIAEYMNSINPLYIPRNHLVERAIQLGVEEQDFSYMLKLSKILEQPFTPQDIEPEFHLPPKEEEKVLQTFCGT